MLKHFLLIARRNMSRQKMHTVILLSGLTIGLTACFWMFYWIIQEWRFEDIHANANRIFRVELKLNDPDGSHLSAATATPLAPLLKAEFPEVASAARIHPFALVNLRFEDRSFSEDHIMAADPALLSMFTFKPVYGNLSGALDDGNAIVLTESVSEKYFGKGVDPVGEILHIDDETGLRVTAVIRDLPVNTHLDFTILIPLNLAHRMGREISPDHWNRLDEIHTYILLNDQASRRDLEAKIASIQSARVQDSRDLLYLRPLKQIHFASDVIYDFAVHADKRMLYGLSLIAFMVFIMACVNFITLTSAMTLKQRHAIGVRKVYGANRYQMISQMMTEIFLNTGLAVIAALLCIELTKPVFARLTSRPVSSISIGDVHSVFLLMGLALLMDIVIGVLPAIRFSAIKSVEAFRNTRGTGLVRKGAVHPLILLQFIMVIGLVSGTVIIQQQLHYMMRKPAGYAHERLISVPLAMPMGTGIRSERFDIFRDALMQHAAIQNVTMTTTSPENIATAAGEAEWEGQPPDRSVMVHWCSVWYDYFETLELAITDGRDFSREFPNDMGDNYILNQTAVDQMGLKDPVGKSFSLFGKKGVIVGVVQDFHYRSLHTAIEPIAFDMAPWYNHILLVRLAPGRDQEGLTILESTWKEFNPGYPFECESVSSAYERLYQGERNTETLLGLFAFLAMVLACLGLLGIASFFTDARTKEIGIRKVLGASAFGVLGLLTKDFVRWILIANLIAWPVAYYAMNKWLQGFAYRIDLTIWPFLLSGLTALIITLLTVSWQAVRAAMANPVKSLRYE